MVRLPTLSIPRRRRRPSSAQGPGPYTSNQTVAIATSTRDATIYYTTNGSTPTTGSPLYAGPITVSTSQTVNAIAVASGYPTSAVGSAAYTINTTATATPNFPVAVSPGALSVTAGQSGVLTVTVTAQNSFSVPLTFSCAGRPPGASCNFSQATVTPADGAASTALTVTTSTSTTAALRPQPHPMVPGLVAGGCALLLWQEKRRDFQILMLAPAALGLSVCSGCGASVNSAIQVGTKVTTSTVIVIATSGSTQLGTIFTLSLEEVD